MNTENQQEQLFDIPSQQSGLFDRGIFFSGWITVQVCRADGTFEEPHTKKNIRTNAGALATMQMLAGTGGNAFNYLALSSNTLSASGTDTVLSGEITTNGFARQQAQIGTYTPPTTNGGSASYVLTTNFTAASGVGSGGQVIASAALFNAASGGIMFTETNLGSAETIYSGDVVLVQYTIGF